MPRKTLNYKASQAQKSNYVCIFILISTAGPPSELSITCPIVVVYAVKAPSIYTKFVYVQVISMLIWKIHHHKEHRYVIEIIWAKHNMNKNSKCFNFDV